MLIGLTGHGRQCHCIEALSFACIAFTLELSFRACIACVVVVVACIAFTLKPIYELHVRTKSQAVVEAQYMSGAAQPSFNCAAAAVASGAAEFQVVLITHQLRHLLYISDVSQIFKEIPDSPC